MTQSFLHSTISQVILFDEVLNHKISSLLGLATSVTGYGGRGKYCVFYCLTKITFVTFVKKLIFEF